MKGRENIKSKTVIRIRGVDEGLGASMTTGSRQGRGGGWLTETGMGRVNVVVLLCVGFLVLTSSLTILQSGPCRHGKDLQNVPNCVK